LHGLGRTHRSLGRLRRRVSEAGLETWARTYPSRRTGIVELSATVAAWLREDLGERELVAVTHSLGGILLRHMADRLPWRGAVMLAPPNAGSRVAAALGPHPLFRWMFGPAGQEVGRPDRWPAPPRPFAIIAGTAGARGASPPSWLVAARGMLPAGEPSDGTLTVAETRLDGMADFATVPASHTWIMDHPEVAPMILRFFDTGRFRGVGRPSGR
jgi:hypothetical protein